MLKKYFLMLAFVVVCIPGYSLLSPFYQSTKEITSLLQDERFIVAFQKQRVSPVTKIERTESGYRVYSPDFYLDAEILYSNPGMPGPMMFDWNFHEPVFFDTCEK